MRWIAWAASACSLEGAAVWAWSRGPGSAAFLVLHLLASLAVARLLLLALPAGVEQRRGSGLLCLFCLSVFAPVLGPAGLLLGLVLPLRAGAARGVAPATRRVAVPDLPVRAPEAPRALTDSLASVLRSAASAERRVRAVRSTRRLPDETAVPLLERALADPEDDVRLLAFSLRQARETARSGAAASGPDAAPGRRRLAFAHWELARSGVVPTDAAARALATARELAETELERRPGDRGLALLLAEIALADGDEVRAATALDTAVRLGLPATVLAPLRAELELRARRWAGVRAHLAAAGRPFPRGARGAIAAIRIT